MSRKDELRYSNMYMLVDATARHAKFSFIDALSACNHIRTYLKDSEAFKISIGNFYRTIMPFSLKNSAATYQRAMAAIFHDMLPRRTLLMKL